MNSKKVLEKLVKIAFNQQKMLQTLAQAAQDPNVAYLKRVSEAAVLNINAGVPVNVQVSANAPEASPAPGIHIDQNYTVRLTGLKDEKMKNQFKINLDNALKMQKPELLGVVNVFYV